MRQSRNPLITHNLREVFIRQGKCRTSEARDGWMARRLGMRPTLPRTTATWWWRRSKPSFIDPSSPVWDFVGSAVADFQQWDQEKPQQKAEVADSPKRAERIGPKCSVIWMRVFSSAYLRGERRAGPPGRAGSQSTYRRQSVPRPARFSQTPSSAARSEPTNDLAAYLRSIGATEASLDVAG